MLTKLLHIGFAVHSIDATLAALEKLGARELGRKALPQIGQTSALVEVGGIRYELMEPLGDAGVIPKFLAKHGEGFHHISFQCPDIEAELAEFLAAGGQALNKEPGDGKFKFFTKPQTTGGILYEISERED